MADVGGGGHSARVWLQTDFINSFKLNITSVVYSDKLLYEVLKIGLENAALCQRSRTALSRPRLKSFSIWTDPRPANNLSIFSSLSQIIIFILSLSPAHIQCALQMQ